MSGDELSVLFQNSGDAYRSLPGLRSGGKAHRLNFNLHKEVDDVRCVRLLNEQRKDVRCVAIVFIARLRHASNPDRVPKIMQDFFDAPKEFRLFGWESAAHF